MDCPVGGDAELYPVDPGLAADGDFRLEAPADEAVQDNEYWRRELAARLQRYRARRKPRAPRYPSLRLPFDEVDQRLATNARPGLSSSTAGHALVAAPSPADTESAVHEPEAEPIAVIAYEPEAFHNVIEFPRSAVLPVVRGYELADPVLDRPRIVEAPEVLPPPPALGGVLIDPPIMPHVEKDIALIPLAAPLHRRFLAGAIDCLVLVVVLAAFFAMFLWVNPQLPPWPILVAGALLAWTSFWAGYQFSFLTYTGATVGMRLLRLRLTRFDGTPPTRSLRRWRVFASYLSALSLGLGYLWSVLDEEGLCWHDRMTRTYIS